MQVVKPEVLVRWNPAARVKSVGGRGATRLVSGRTAMRHPLDLLLICCAISSGVLQSGRFGMGLRIVHDLSEALV